MDDFTLRILEQLEDYESDQDNDEQVDPNVGGPSSRAPASGAVLNSNDAESILNKLEDLLRDEVALAEMLQNSKFAQDFRNPEQYQVMATQRIDLLEKYYEHILPSVGEGPPAKIIQWIKDGVNRTISRMCLEAQSGIESLERKVLVMRFYQNTRVVEKDGKVQLVTDLQFPNHPEEDPAEFDLQEKRVDDVRRTRAELDHYLNRKKRGDTSSDIGERSDSRP